MRIRHALIGVLTMTSLATGTAALVAAPASADASGAPYVVSQRCKAWLDGTRCDWYWSNGDHTVIYR